MSSYRTRITIGTALAALALTASCTGETPDTVASQAPTLPAAAASATPAPVPKPSTVDVLATGLRAPWGVAFLPDGSALVTERDSRRVLRVGPGTSGGRLTVAEV